MKNLILLVKKKIKLKNKPHKIPKIGALESLKISDGIIQDENKARYWDPIPDVKFQEVLRKINSKSYRYQKL